MYERAMIEEPKPNGTAIKGKWKMTKRWRMKEVRRYLRGIYS